MSLYLGSSKAGALYHGSTKIGQAYIGSVKIYQSGNPYNPLGLPPYTIRLRYADGVTPTFSKGTGVQVSASPNIWDLTYENTNWRSLRQDDRQLLEILGANTTGVTQMGYMLYWNSSLPTIPLFDTSAVEDFGFMCDHCQSLTSVPAFNVSSARWVNYMFDGCYNVEQGALALYNRLSARPEVTSYTNCFNKCGRDTVTGAAELAQIPTSWGGTMA